MWISQSKIPGRTNQRGPLGFSEFCLQEPYQVFIVNIGGKFNIYISAKRKGKATILKYAKALYSSQSIMFLMRSEETILPKPNLLGFYKCLSYLGERNYPTSAPSNHTVPPKEGVWEGKRLKSTIEVYSLGHRFTKD